MESDLSAQPLHVLDLPQLYQRPSFVSLRNALSAFSTRPQAFGLELQSSVLPEGATRYLTGVVSSPLEWIKDDDQREELWNLASQCLSARSGRTGMGNISRTFAIPSSDGDINIELYEPALVGDNLGFKTWSSSFVAARRLHLYSPLSLVNSNISRETKPLILELGAGTGLLGLAAAMIWHTAVIMTDLPEIAPNIATNIQKNASQLLRYGGQGYSGILDWQDPASFQVPTAAGVSRKASVILVADPIYSSEHPRMLAHAVETWLEREASARLFLAYPSRAPFQGQIDELFTLLTKIGLKRFETFTESVRDDWHDDVICCSEVWAWMTYA